MIAFLALALVQAATTSPAPAPADDPANDVVVVAVLPKKCQLSVADRSLSWGQMDDFARMYGVGRPVQVRAPIDLDRKCMIKIMLHLANRGFKYVQFVDPQGRVPPPQDPLKQTVIRSR